MRVQGWDPVMIICQIISLQTIHYLTLTLLLPPLLATFSLSEPLLYSGGPNTVGHVLDWRELAGRSTVTSSSLWQKSTGVWSGGRVVGVDVDVDVGAATSGKNEGEIWDLGIDGTRGWVIGLTWLIASAIDIIPLYYLIRRPTYILDFALTLLFIHLILTTYYAASFPTSLYFWIVQALGAIIMILVAEQLCVKREMNTELDTNWAGNEAEEGEAMELT